VPGLYNAYNALAATAVARVFHVPTATISSALAAFQAAFGRIERATVDGRTLTLALVKNPTGFNEVLRMLTAGQVGGNSEPLLTIPTMIAINDLDADGRDVSWLWDVDFEMLAAGDAPLATAGIRGADMANRLKYAGVEPSLIRQLPADLPVALEQFLASLPDGGSGYILPTYTAMLAIRQALVERGALESFWKQ
jgi:UDP-N-acetylmuramyl tripeptide synthase